MAVLVPSWFDLNYYLSQKVGQMNDIQFDMEWLQARDAAKWNASLVGTYMEGWPWGKPDQVPLEGNTLREKSYSNFLACNAEEYAVNVGRAAINVSGTPLFDVEVYLQNLADFHNSQSEAGAAKATVQTEMQALLAAKTSAWGYFQEHWQDMPQVNPSNNFDISAYISARAAQTGMTPAQVMSEIQAKGENPIADFSVWGPAHGMNEAPKPATPTEPQLPGGWGIWGPIQEPDAPTPPTPSRPVLPGGGGGGGGGNQPTPDPKPSDPYDENVKTVDMSADKGEYEGEYGQNTRFEAALDKEAATLKSTDIIKGGEDAMNTLAVELGENWNGFDGVKDDDGVEQPNVTNVGRIQLSHTGDDSLQFSAKNISDDAVRYDLDSKNSANTISLSDLGSKVEEVRISNVAGGEDETPATGVSFAEDKAPENLTLVLNNVSPTVVNKIETGQEAQALADAAAASSAAPDALNLNIAGVENLTVRAESSASAQAAGDDYTSERMAGISVDLSGSDALKTLEVSGNGDIALWGLDGAHIASMDASAATGDVTFGVKNLTDQVVKGGSGRDMISFDVDAANVSKANWTGIEDVLMRHGGTIDASGVDGLRELWNLSHGETCEIQNLKADDFYVCGAPTWGQNIYQHVIVNGDIGNLTWTSAERGIGEQYFSTLDSNVKGNFHLNVGYKDVLAPNPDGGGNFSSYRLPEMQGDISVDIANPAPDGFSGIHIEAPKATSLAINAAGSLALGGDTDLSSVENLTVNLKSAINADDRHDQFYLGDNIHSNVSLQSVRQIDIAGVDDSTPSFMLGNIGGDQNEGMTINTSNVVNFSLESASVSDEGALTLKMNGLEAHLGSLIAGKVDVNASGCAGTVEIADIQAIHGVFYVGGNGQYEDTGGNIGDNLTVTRLGNGSSSDFRLGGGDDILFVHLSEDSLGASGIATVDVELGDGKDYLGVGTHTGLLRVNVHDYTGEDAMSVIQSGLEIDMATAQKYLETFGIRAAESDIVLFNVAVEGHPDSTAVEYNSDVYLFSPGAENGLTMTVLEGLTADDADIIHLR